MTEYNDRIRQIKVTDENGRSKGLIKLQMKMTDGNDRCGRLIKCSTTVGSYGWVHIRSMEFLIYLAAGEPVSLIYLAAAEAVSLVYPAAGEPVSS